MKKTIALFIFLVSIIFTAPAIAVMPTYSDDLPEEYITNYKKNANIDYKQALPIYNTEKSLDVKVYSQKTIFIKLSAKVENKKIVYSQNYNINDELKFVIADDVMKNGSVYIKKGTEAVGLIRNAQFGQGVYTAPDELQISMFTTKDINNKPVKLYGTILIEGKDLGLFSSGGVPTCRAYIPKNKIYTLSAKK